MCEICSNLTIKTSERRQRSRSVAFIVNFEQISQIVLVFRLFDFEHLLKKSLMENFSFCAVNKTQKQNGINLSSSEWSRPSRGLLILLTLLRLCKWNNKEFGKTCMNFRVFVSNSVKLSKLWRSESKLAPSIIADVRNILERNVFCFVLVWVSCTKAELYFFQHSPVSEKP